MTADDQNLLEIALLVATAAALLLGAAWRSRAGQRVVGALMLVLVVGASLAYLDVGGPKRMSGLVHTHEQYHFYFGSKYLEELRYDLLYPATVVAREGTPQVRGVKEVRDCLTFQMVPVDEVLARSEEVQGRFSAPRWAEFQADLDAYLEVAQRPLTRLVGDHGNTGSPAWAALAALATANVPMSADAMTGFALIDLGLLLLLFLLAWRAVGLPGAAAGLVMALLAVRGWSYVGGSILRLDWLFAVAASALAFHTRRWRLAGLLLGYAVATKLFCGAIALALGLRFIAQALRDRRIAREHVELVLAAFAGLLLAVIASSVVFGGPAIWVDYWERILVTFHEGYYRGQYSFRDVFLQLAADPTAAFEVGPPRKVAAALRGAELSSPAMWGARAAVVLALAWVSSRHEAVASYALGLLMVYVLLVTNIYYWQAWLLFGLVLALPGPGLWRRMAWLLGGVAIQVGTHLILLWDWEVRVQGWFGSFWLAWLCLGIVLLELAHAGWTRLRASR